MYGCRGAAAGALVLLAVVGNAQAATVTLTPPDPDDFYDIVATAEVRDDAGERNDLVVDGRRYGRFAVRERGDATLRAGRGCRQRSPQRVTCGFIDEIVAVVVRAGDRDDSVRCRGFLGVVRGGPGDDALSTADGCRLDLAGESGDDALVGGRRKQVLVGGSGRDAITGGTGNDRLYGDGVEEGHARDALDGGEGVDVVVLAGEQRRVHVDLSRGLGPDRDSLRRIENVIGTRMSDVLVGDEGPNRLQGGGGEGRDRLSGRGGRDVLDSGRWMRCGSGRDLVMYPGRALLSPGCELMYDFQYLDFERVPIFPRALSDERIAVPAVCHGDIEKCRHEAVVTSSGIELGRSQTVPSSTTDFVTWIPVPLEHPLPRNRPVEVTTFTSEYDEFEADEGESPWSGFIEFSWRIRCRGGPDCRGAR